MWQRAGVGSHLLEHLLVVRTPISLLATCREGKEQYLIIPTMHFNHIASVGCTCTTYIDTDISRICNLLNTRPKVPYCGYVPNAEGHIYSILYWYIPFPPGGGGGGWRGRINSRNYFGWRKYEKQKEEKKGDNLNEKGRKRTYKGKMERKI
jgi:hypothetical protein